MNTEVSRRDFIKIAFGTVSAAVLSDPVFAQLLPSGVAALPVCPAYPLAIDPSGYLYDPTYDFALPSYREMLSKDLSLSGLPEEEQIRLFARWLGIDDAEDLDNYRLDLDDQVDPERCSPHWLAESSEWHTGLELYEKLDEGARNRLGLDLVDGEQPGSDFMAVRCDKPDTLQTELLREGINVKIG